jgi:ABC-type Fe3+ transport system substrate-binding protein
MTEPYVSPLRHPPEHKDAEGHWTGFSARARAARPSDRGRRASSIRDLVDPRYRGRVAIANPLFGTTTAEIAALFASQGDAWAREWMAGLKANEVRVTASNGESADAVASGEVAFSLVDSDDAVSRMRQERPVRMIVPDQGEGGLGVFLVPNAVLIVRGAPHPDAARRLVDFLLSPETEGKLAKADCAQIPLHAGVEPPPELPAITSLRLMPVDVAPVAAKMQELRPYLEAWSGCDVAARHAVCGRGRAGRRGSTAAARDAHRERLDTGRLRLRRLRASSVRAGPVPLLRSLGVARSPRAARSLIGCGRRRSRSNGRIPGRDRHARVAVPSSSDLRPGGRLGARARSQRAGARLPCWRRSRARLVLRSAVLLGTRASLRAVDPRPEDAARLSAGWPDAATGDLAAGAVGTVRTAGLVFLLALGDLGVATYLGVDVFPTASFTSSPPFIASARQRHLQCRC